LRREVIVESLLADIVHGRVLAGQHLVTQELADRFGVSHTPIREALIALGGIGLVTLQPNRGALVRQISAREVREVCRVRRALECEAVRGACGRIDRAELEKIRDELPRLRGLNGRANARSITKARDLDSRLHDLIARSARNQFLANELNRLKLLFRAFRDVAWEHDHAHNNFHRLAEEAAEHLAIVDALLTGDRPAAMTAMSRHLISGMKYWTRALPTTDAPSPVARSPRRNGSHQ
jgi:DNA-binding GntR family transcriptional regulator